MLLGMKKKTAPWRSGLSLATLAALLAAVAFIGYGKFHQSAPPGDMGDAERDRPGTWTFLDEQGRPLGFFEHLVFRRAAISVFAVDRAGRGKPNEWSYFDAKGHLLGFEKDRSGSGKPDIRNVYRWDERAGHDVIARNDMDLVCKDLFDTYAYYDAQGNLERVERDRNCDGKIDIISYFDDPNRAPYKMLWDDHFTGVFNRTTYRDGDPVTGAKSVENPVTPAAAPPTR
jgi:hypothetical protein